MSKEINDIDFINLANHNVGKGLLQTGKSNFELAQKHAMNESIAFIKWAVYNYTVDFEGFSFPVWIDGKEYSAEKLFYLYQQQTKQ